MYDCYHDNTSTCFVARFLFLNVVLVLIRERYTEFLLSVYRKSHMVRTIRIQMPTMADPCLVLQNQKFTK